MSATTTGQPGSESAVTPRPLVLPQWALQHDWTVDVAAGHGSFWVSYRGPGSQRSTYGTVQVGAQLAAGSGLVELSDADGGFECNHLAQLQLEVKLPTGDRDSVVFCAPDSTVPTPGRDEILDIGLSPAGGMAVTAGHDGRVLVWDLTAGGTPERALEGHVSDVTACRFFPSGQVILTGGADARLKIWAVDDGSCAVTLTGHTAGVTATGLIARGRNFLSSARDGTVRLWDCGSQRCLATVVQCRQAANDIALRPGSALVAESGVPAGTDEHGTEGHLCVVGCESGDLTGCDVRARGGVLSARAGAAINSCAFASDVEVLVGCDGGLCQVFDVRNPGAAVHTARRGDANVTSVTALGASRFLVAAQDGAAFVYDRELAKLTLELTGPDSDSVSVCRCLGASTVYAGGKDGQLRRYRLPPPRT